MSATKVVILVLVLVAALFVVLAVWGAGNNRSQTTSGDPNKDAQNFSAPPLLDRLNGVVAGFAPRLDAGHLEPSSTVFDLGKQNHYSVQVLSNSSHKYRQAKFKIEPPDGCAHLAYTEAASDTPDSLKQQDSLKAKDPNQFSFTIGAQGGTLTLDRKPATPARPCTVQLE